MKLVWGPGGGGDVVVHSSMHWYYGVRDNLFLDEQFQLNSFIKIAVEYTHTIIYVNVAAQRCDFIFKIMIVEWRIMIQVVLHFCN